MKYNPELRNTLLIKYSFLRAAIYCVTKWFLPLRRNILKICSGDRTSSSCFDNVETSCRHSFKENSDDMSRINLDSNPLFHQINSSVVVAVINFIYTGRKKTIGTFVSIFWSPCAQYIDFHFFKFVSQQVS